MMIAFTVVVALVDPLTMIVFAVLVALVLPFISSFSVFDIERG